MDRVILPLPRRRVAPLTPGYQDAHINAGGARAVSDASVQSSSITGRHDSYSVRQHDHLHNNSSSQARMVGGHETAVYESASEEDNGLEEEDDDDCSGCRDWLDNAKNKKKRKIPSAGGHEWTASTTNSQIVPATGTTPPIRRVGALQPRASRRRRTWDVSSDQPPNTATAQTMTAAAVAAAAQIRPFAPEGAFDFVCDSPVAHNLPAPPPPPVKIPNHDPIDVGTQTTPSLADMEPILPIRHRRTKEEREFDRKMLVRRQRRDARRKLKPGETLPIWVCQFCEFEDVFGYAPLAVISGYEERVRQARRVALERKRLLEKARTRGKKKKSVAANKHQAAKQAAAAAAAQQQQQQVNAASTGNANVAATAGAQGPMAATTTTTATTYASTGTGTGTEAGIGVSTSTTGTTMMSSAGIDAAVLASGPGEAPTAELPQPPLHYDKSIGPGGCTCCDDPHDHLDHAHPHAHAQAQHVHADAI